MLLVIIPLLYLHASSCMDGTIPRRMKKTNTPAKNPKSVFYLFQSNVVLIFLFILKCFTFLVSLTLLTLLFSLTFVFNFSFQSNGVYSSLQSNAF